MKAKCSREMEHAYDKLGLFLLAGGVVGVIAMIVVGVFWTRTVPDKSDSIMGMIVTGLVLFLRDLIAAVRTSWEERSRTQITEKLADAPGKTPSKVEINQPEGNPVPTKDVTGE